MRPGHPQHQQYHGGPPAFKQPYAGSLGYPQDYPQQQQQQHSNQHQHHHNPHQPTGYLGGGGGGGSGSGSGSGADHWRTGSAPASTLQKKPKELDKAMWVGNVLSDTTPEELRAIFESEPTEEEGDIEHDEPEVKELLLVSQSMLLQDCSSTDTCVLPGPSRVSLF